MEKTEDERYLPGGFSGRKQDEVMSMAALLRTTAPKRNNSAVARPTLWDETTPRL